MAPSLFHGRTRGRGEEAKCDRAQAQLEQATARRRLDVIVSFGCGPLDDRDLTIVEAEIAVERFLGGRCRVRIGQVDARWARIDDSVPIGKLCELRRTLSGENNGGVLLAERKEPLIDPCTEEGVHERHPRFVDLDQCGTSVKTLLDPVKEVEKNR